MRNKIPLTAAVERAFPIDGIRVWLYAHFRERRERAIVTNLDAEEMDETRYYEPSFIMNNADVEILMTELWNLGYRPSGVDSVGATEAKNLHLDDLREVNGRLFGLLENCTQEKKTDG